MGRDVRRLGRWDDDRRTPRPRRFVDGDRVRGGVSGDAHERALDCGEQIEGGGRILPRRLGQRVDTDHAGLIDAKVELPPATPAAATVCRGSPLTGPDDGQPRAVEHEMEALAGRDQSQTTPQMLTAPGERRRVGGGEVEAHHPEQGVQESFGLAQREMVEEPQGQGGLDGEIRVAPLPAPPATPTGRPGSDRFRGHPHRHIAASNEGLIVGRPVRHPILRLIRGMNLRLHPRSVAPAEGPEKCGPRRPTRNGYSCNNAKTRLHHSMRFPLDSDRFRGQPHRHIAASNEGLIVGRPVRNAVLRLIRGMDLRLHPCSVAPAEDHEKCGPNHPTRSGYSCNNAPERVRVHDFPDDAVGKAIPYGVYDMARNEAWVSVGRDHDTPAFAVASIRQWGTMMGRHAYPAADALYLTADAGGSNGYRSRGWKTALQRLADDVGLRIHVSHFPPGTSKWNKGEHRLFCHITQNWRGRPLRTFETVVALIGHTRTATGLRVRAKLDKRRYKVGLVVPLAEMRRLSLHPHVFHGDWNYELRPRPT